MCQLACGVWAQAVRLCMLFLDDSYAKVQATDGPPPAGLQGVGVL